MMNTAGLHAVCVPYPTELPADLWGLILDAVQGKPVDVPCAIHCAWTAAGFVLGKAVPSDCKMEGADPKTVLEGLATGKTMAGGAIPWGVLLPLLLQLLEKLLAGGGGQ